MKKEHSRFYQKEAGRYHELRYGSWYGSIAAEAHHDILREILAGRERPLIILDVACGTGHNIGVLSEAGDLVVACDLTPEMMEMARKRLGPRRNVHYLRGDAFQIPFLDNTFDVVTSSRFLHLLDDSRQKKVLLEILRVLKPGGTMAVDFFNIHHWRILALPIFVYRALLKKRPTGSTMSNINEITDWMRRNKINVAGTIGVGSYFLVLSWIFPRRFSLALAGLFRKGPLKMLAEQIIVIGEKRV